MSSVRLPYRDRHHGGQVLADHLAHYRDQPELLVLALPRGGVAVGYEVAQALNAPLDVFVVRKLGFPGHEEYAMGAIATGGVRVMNDMPGLQVSDADIESATERARAELQRRERLYRGEAPAMTLEGRTVIVVDDGLATGATMRAAAEAIRMQGPRHLCVAVPVGARESCQALSHVADAVVCPATPEPFHAVGLWYQDFPQASDEEVQQLLEQAHATH